MYRVFVYTWICTYIHTYIVYMRNSKTRYPTNLEEVNKRSKQNSNFSHSSPKNISRTPQKKLTKYIHYH